MKRLTDRLIAFDGSGRRHVLFVYTVYEEVAAAGGASDVREIRKEIATSHGDALTVVSRGVYKITRSGVVIRSLKRPRVQQVAPAIRSRRRTSTACKQR